MSAISPAGTADTLAVPAASRATRRRSGGRRRGLLDLIGLLPFLAYTAAFLLVPTVSVMVGAFRANQGAGFTGENVSAALTGRFLHSFVLSIELSALTAVVGAVVGLAFAYAVVTSRRATVLRQAITSLSGVLANFGGVPLAFMFIATVGNAGLVTRWLSDAGIDLYGTGFSLFSFSGIAIVYLYFQIPLMVLVILPPLDGLKPQWAEAAASLGARRWQYWRYVAGPVLTPAFLAALLLLFANSFSAYATAYALTSGSVPLVPIQIGSVLSGNVIANQENLGKALGLGMIVIVGVVMAAYAMLQRRTSKWLR